MANKRETAVQKRQRANRAQREALAARKTAASTPRPSRQAPVAARRTGGEAKAPASRPADAAADDRGGRRSRRVRPPRPGDTPVDVAELEGSFYRRVMQVPGGSQAAQGFFLAVVAVIFSVVSAFLVHTIPPEGAPGGDRSAVGVDTPIGRFGFVVLVPMLLIAVAATLGFVFALHAQRRRIWLMVAVVAGVFVFQGLVLFVFVAGMFAYAVMRSSKVEGPNEPLFGSRRRPRRGRAEPDDDAVESTATETDADADQR